MRDGFDTRELTAFENDLLDLATRQMPRETKRFMKNEGKKLKKATVKTAKSKVDKGEGDYFKSIKSGKVYKYGGSNGALSNRVYSYKPHAHLIEYGHRQVLNPYKERGAANIGGRFSRAVKEGKGIGIEIGFVPGKKIFETAAEEFKDEYFRDTREFIDNLLEEGLG